MDIAVTGGTGFIGQKLLEVLLGEGHRVRAWYRSDSAPEIFPEVDWIPGDLNRLSSDTLLDGCQAVVHAAVYRDQASFQAAPQSLLEYARINMLGTLELMENAVRRKLSRFVFVSTCAVHDVILDDRKLDEAHPLWPKSHYGAHKAALEKFVHSYGLGNSVPICALRPTGVYGVRNPIQHSKWYDLIADVAQGRPVVCSRGGKEVHVEDVAKAIHLLLTADENSIKGQSFACYDRYISEYDVARVAQQQSGSGSEILGEPMVPRHQIDASKLKSLGMTFGGQQRLEETVQQLLEQLDG